MGFFSILSNVNLAISIINCKLFTAELLNAKGRLIGNCVGTQKSFTIYYTFLLLLDLLLHISSSSKYSPCGKILSICVRLNDIRWIMLLVWVRHAIHFNNVLFPFVYDTILKKTLLENPFVFEISFYCFKDYYSHQHCTIFPSSISITSLLQSNAVPVSFPNRF